MHDSRLRGHLIELLDLIPQRILNSLSVALALRGGKRKRKIHGSYITDVNFLKQKLLLKLLEAIGPGENNVSRH